MMRCIAISGGQPADPDMDSDRWDWPCYIARFRPWEMPVSIESQPLELIVDGYPEQRGGADDENYKTFVHLKMIRQPKGVLIWEAYYPLVNLWEKPAMVMEEFT